MHPVLFEAGPLTIYTYGFFIALGAIAGALFMWRQGKKRYGMTFDQANTLFILLLVAGIVGGKLFMLFESPSYYFNHPSSLLSKNGFVFYGSLLVAIPVMLIFFRRSKLPVLGMLDVMAMVTCVVHGFGRIGCFNAGCCYGKPTQSFLGVVFTDPVCQAEPLGVALHPTQLYEAGFVFLLLVFLFYVDRRKKFDGQVFLLYLILYAVGRSIIELFRADLDRGFVIENVLTNAQTVSIVVVVAAAISYVKLRQKAIFPKSK
ncbi:MAG: prolipoprotein diacylglyceryl transferase [Bacteroidetes bacterium]|nr:prolipoprotein diacylglyceryl transferase [Bacteroidota bacterium]